MELVGNSPWQSRIARLSVEVPDIRARLDRDNMYRSCGDMICDTCGKKYLHHPMIKGYEWLNLICNNDIVKL